MRGGKRGSIHRKKQGSKGKSGEGGEVVEEGEGGGEDVLLFEVRVASLGEER